MVKYPSASERNTYSSFIIKQNWGKKEEQIQFPEAGGYLFFCRDILSKST
jgi:hypothetical protein